VKLHLYEQSDSLVLDCVNSKSKITRLHDVGCIGLANIRKRLDLAYGNEYDLDIRDSKEVYQLTLKIAYA
jgi:two-component system, LytTR family, sensor kinase